MKPAPFAYAKARSLDHAIALLDGAPEARVLAGGQSLMPALNMRLSAPPLLVDINGVSELARIAQPNGQIELGGLVRHAQAEHSQDVARLAPLLSKAIPHIAHPAIRNRGTIGGSIALADPAAELPACLLALGGEIEIAGRAGRRTVAADTFFKGLFETALAPGELSAPSGYRSRNRVTDLALPNWRAGMATTRWSVLRPRRAPSHLRSGLLISASARHRFVPARPKRPSPAATSTRRSRPWPAISNQAATCTRVPPQSGISRRFCYVA